VRQLLASAAVAVTRRPSAATLRLFSDHPPVRGASPIHVIFGDITV
jgi:hypothetical protein